MKIRDIATKTGLSQQAVYKRLKGKGIPLDAIRDPKTGHLTAEGEALARELFNLDDQPLNTGNDQLNTGANVDNRGESVVNELKTEVESLRAQVHDLEAQVKLLEAEKALLIENRETLKTALDRSQQLEAAALARVPQVPLLPARSGGLFGWLRRRKEEQ